MPKAPLESEDFLCKELRRHLASLASITACGKFCYKAAICKPSMVFSGVPPDLVKCITIFFPEEFQEVDPLNEIQMLIPKDGILQYLPPSAVP